MNHLHNYQAKYHQSFQFHFPLQAHYNPMYQQILLLFITQLWPRELNPKLDQLLHLHVHQLSPSLWFSSQGIIQKTSIQDPFCRQTGYLCISKPSGKNKAFISAKINTSTIQVHMQTRSSPPRQRDRFQLRSRPRSITPPAQFRPRSASHRRRPKPVHLQAASSILQETHHGLFFNPQIEGMENPPQTSSSQSTGLETRHTQRWSKTSKRTTLHSSWGRTLRGRDLLGQCPNPR